MKTLAYCANLTAMLSGPGSSNGETTAPEHIRELVAAQRPKEPWLADVVCLFRDAFVAELPQALAIIGLPRRSPKCVKDRDWGTRKAYRTLVIRIDGGVAMPVPFREALQALLKRANPAWRLDCSFHSSFDEEQMSVVARIQCMPNGRERLDALSRLLPALDAHKISLAEDHAS